MRANLTNIDFRDAYIDLDENVGKEIKFYYSVVWSENPTCVIASRTSPPVTAPPPCAGETTY